MIMSDSAKFSLTLRVNNFESRITESKNIWHSFSSSGDMHWRLRICEGDKGDISIYLFLLKIKLGEQVQGITRFSILNKDGHEVDTTQTGLCEYEASGSGWGKTNFFTRDLLKEARGELLPGGVLTVFSEVDTQLIPPGPKLEEFNLLNNLYFDRKFSDVTIYASGIELKAHKAILAARSPVFDRMFSNDMKEANLNRVEVAEFQGDVLEAMLKFIYTNVSPFGQKLKTIQAEIDEERKLAIDLYKVADKYQIDGLKIFSEKRICQYLQVETIIQVLLLADHYNSPELRDQSLRYICLNSKQVIESDDWSCLVKERPDLTIDVVRNIVSYMSRPSSRQILCDSI